MIVMTNQNETDAPIVNPDFRPFSIEFRDEFYRALRSRRSIRKFKSDFVPQEVLSRIFEGAMQAPSGKNLQNWRFFILQGKKRDEYVEYSRKSWTNIRPILEKKLKPSLFQFTERFFFTLGDAPVVVLCYSMNDLEENRLTSIGSVYMAVENFNLACVVEGLGCCTMGAPLEIKNEINEFLGLKDNAEILNGRLELLCGIVLGYPDHEPPKAKRQTEDRLTFLS